MIFARLLLLFVVLSSSGCGRVTSHVARSAIPEVVESGLETATTPENAERLQKLLDEATVRAAVAGIDDVVIDRVLARLAAPENQRHVKQLTSSIASAMLDQFTAPPSPETKKRREAFIEFSVKTAIRASAEELANVLPQLIHEVAGDPKVKEAMAPLGRTAAHGAIEGTADKVLPGR